VKLYVGHREVLGVGGGVVVVAGVKVGVKLVELLLLLAVFEGS
jgi:hypothetical protein